MTERYKLHIYHVHKHIVYLPNAMISSTLVFPHDTQLLSSALTPLPLRHWPHK